LNRTSAVGVRVCPLQLLGRGLGKAAEQPRLDVSLPDGVDHRFMAENGIRMSGARHQGETSDPSKSRENTDMTPAYPRPARASVHNGTSRPADGPAAGPEVVTLGLLFVPSTDNFHRVERRKV